MLGSLIIYLKGMRRMMFQLSGFYYIIKGLLRKLDPESPTLSLSYATRSMPCPAHRDKRRRDLGA